MKILGLDPGSRFTGYGLVERQGSKLIGHEAGRIRLPQRLGLTERLVLLAEEIESLLARTEPDAVALESLFHGINPKSLIVLAHARGVLMAVIGRRGLAIAEFAPAEVKSAVTGNGRADKQQVARMVGMLLSVSTDALKADATDALAIAICGSQRLRLDRLVERATGQ